MACGSYAEAITCTVARCVSAAAPRGAKSAVLGPGSGRGPGTARHHCRTLGTGRVRQCQSTTPGKRVTGALSIRSGCN